MLKSSPVNRMVDRVVRDVMREAEPELPDLMLHGFPFTPALWLIVVEPLKPRTISDGGIEVVDQSQEAEGFQLTVGRVLKAGPTSLQGRTTAGIDLSHFTDDIRTPAQLVGRFVMWQRHVGQELTLRKSGQRVRVMAVTDLLGVTEDPQAWKFYI